MTKMASTQAHVQVTTAKWSSRENSKSKALTYWPLCFAIVSSLILIVFTWRISKAKGLDQKVAPAVPFLLMFERQCPASPPAKTTTQSCCSWRLQLVRCTEATGLLNQQFHIRELLVNLDFSLSGSGAGSCSKSFLVVQISFWLWQDQQLYLAAQVFCMTLEDIPGRGA